MSQSEILWSQPSHPELIQVLQGASAFSWEAKSLVSLPAGSFFCDLTIGKNVPIPAYSSVQCSRSRHIELQSDLVFTNHSCQPSLEFDTTTLEVRVSRDRDLRKGDALTFFYPSTEWDMAQPFQCQCDSPKDICLRFVRGAKYIDIRVLGRYFINKHIEELLLEEQQEVEQQRQHQINATGSRVPKSANYKILNELLRN